MADPDRVEPVLQDAQAQDPSALKAVAPARQAATASAGPFSLQLGSFTNVDNARKQGDRIRGLGHDPVIEASSLGGQIYHRVMLKGFRNQSEATRLGEKIRSELGIAYLVRRTN
jgi:cell division septation protein DedD